MFLRARQELDLICGVSGAIDVLGRGHGGRTAGRADAPAAPNVLMMRQPPASISADHAGEAPMRPLFWAGLAPARSWPATAPPTFFPCRLRRHSSRGNKLGCRRPPLTLRSCGCRRPVRRLSTAIEAASGGFGQLSGDTTMAQIGTFTRDENGAYAGTIKTLTLNVKAAIKPCDRDSDKAPDYRVTANGVEFGAGWSRTARETGAEYLSLKLDDPSFTAPVYASLVQSDTGEHKLIWSR